MESRSLGSLPFQFPVLFLRNSILCRLYQRHSRQFEGKRPIIERVGDANETETAPSTARYLILVLLVDQLLVEMPAGCAGSIDRDP